MKDKHLESRPRRSCLYMPGSNARALEKAQALPADVILFDLEDAVSPDDKIAARDAVCAAIIHNNYGKRELIVRINPINSEWGADDLSAAVRARASGVLVPKITCGADIQAIDAAMTSAGAPADMALWVMIEMPMALLNIHGIAQCSANTRLTAFVVGTNDLALECRAQITDGRMAFQFALQQIIMAARAYGLIAIDGVYNDIADIDGLSSECAQGRILGFDGKSLIHPAQLDPANEIFAPMPADVAWARAVIAAFDEPANAGKAVIRVDGKMTELLHLEQARRLMAMHAAISDQP
jgi:citrate lyase subunit beta / citryl-CoA lyase